MECWKKTACFTGGIVAFFILVICWNWMQDRGAPVPEESLMITDVSVNTLEGAALVNESGTIAFAVQKGEIYILEEQDMEEEYSATERKAFLYQMAHLNAKRKLEKDAELNWEEFGFAPYRAAVVLLGANGEKFCFYLGDPSPLGDGWYVRREEDNSLWLIDDLPAEMMQYSLASFRNQNVLPDMTTGRLADLNYIRVIHKDSGNDYAIRGNMTQGAVHFVMEEPYQLLADWEIVNEKIFNPLMQLRSLGIVDIEAEPEPDPFLEGESYTLELKISGIDTKLFFVKAEEGTYYCRSSKSEQTILVSDKIETILNSTAEDFVSTSLYSVDTANIEQVAIAADKREAILELKGQGEALSGRYKGKSLNQKESIELLQKFLMLPPAEQLTGEENLDGEDTLTLYIRMKNGNEDSICLIPLSERRYAVQINGLAVFTTYSQTAERLLALLEK